MTVRIKRTPKDSENRHITTTATWILNQRIRHRNTSYWNSQWLRIHITQQSAVQFVWHRAMTVCHQAGTI